MRTPAQSWSRRRILYVSAGVAIPVFAGSLLSAQRAAPRPDATQLSALVEGLLRDHGQGIEASLWLGGDAGTSSEREYACGEQVTAKQRTDALSHHCVMGVDRHRTVRA